MRRRRRRTVPVTENTDRWLVSYADFITLLFAFFVVMFAVSQADKNGAKAVSESIKKALASGGRSAPVTKPALTVPFEALQQDLKSEVENGSVRLALEHRGLVISLEAGAFFPSGAAEIDPAAYAAVEKVVSVIGKLPNSIHLEGHTDSRPIKNSRFQSNWELSASRSIAMLRLLNEHFGIDIRRMSIAGYADNQAIDSNTTDGGPGSNRRVDIVLDNPS